MDFEGSSSCSCSAFSIRVHADVLDDCGVFEVIRAVEVIRVIKVVRMVEVVYKYSTLLN